MSDRLWSCACGAQSMRSKLRLAAQPWRVIRGEDYCPECAPSKYLELSSTLAQPTGPPAGLVASAPWNAPPEWAEARDRARRLRKLKEEPPPPPKPKQPKPRPPRAPPGPGPAGRRAEKALRKDAARTNVAVAAEAGCDLSTVRSARVRLDLPPPPPRRRKPKPPRPSRAKPKPWTGEGPVSRRHRSRRPTAISLAAERALLEAPSRTNKAIAAVLGCSDWVVATARERLRERGDLPPPPPTVRVLVERELLSDASRSNREIAGRLGCSAAAVVKERKRLIERGELPPPSPPTPAVELAEQLQLEDPAASVAAIATLLGCSNGTVENARTRLRRRGLWPTDPSRAP